MSSFSLKKNYYTGEESVSSISIPEEKTGTVIGRGGSNIKKIREASGASIFIKDGVALIRGTNAQRTKAKSLIQEILSKETDQVFPDVGYLLLEIDKNSIDTKQSKIRFKEYRGQDANFHSRNRTTYYVEHITARENEKVKGESSENIDDDDDLTSAISKLLVSNGLPSNSKSSQAFNTTDIIRHCLGDISTLVHKSDPSHIETQSFRLNVFFGRQLFYNFGEKEISVSDWCAMNRSKTSTSFQHNAPRIREKIDLINKKYGFNSVDKEIDDSKKFSISIYYDAEENNKRDRRKLKLHWFEEE
ncbi:4826_t:CDS:2, partial [Ambispora gerdemannii]